MHNILFKVNVIHLNVVIKNQQNKQDITDKKLKTVKAV
jgi:hypothetical protein